MSVAAVRRVVSRLESDDSPTDAELVAALAPTGAERETAFAELVGRHGPMVLGVCRGVLADAHAAEDAFQAVFLVLARKAATIRPPGAVGGWLYGVAVRTARKAKTAAARRQRREMSAIMSANPNAASRERERPENSLDRAELRAVIDAELAALPEAHRAAVVLCDLQGKTRAEAAAELNRAEGTVAAWLSRGRKALAARLARRGVALPAAGLAAVVTPEPVSAELRSAALGAFAGRGVPESVLALAEGVMRSLSSATAKLVAGFVAVGALLAAVATAPAWHADPEPAAPPVVLAPPAPKPQPEVDVNGFAGHSGFIYSVSYAPDGKTFVSVGNGSAVVWDADTQKKVFAAEAEFAAFSADGKSLFVLVKDEFRTLDATTGKQLATKKRQQPKAVDTGTTAAFSPDGTVRVEFDGHAHHLRGDFKGDVPVLAGQKGGAYGDVKWVFGRVAAFSPDGSRFAGIHWKPADSDNDGVLSVWDATTGTLLGTIVSDSAHRVNSFAWSPDGTEIAVGCGDVRVHDAKTLKQARKFDAEWANVVGRFSAVAWSKDGKTLAAGRRVERTNAPTGAGVVEAVTIDVQLLDAQTGKELRRIGGFPDNLPIVSLAFRPDGQQLVAGAGFFPGKAADVPKPAKDAKGLRVIPLGEPAKPEPSAWKEKHTLELTGWLGGSVAYSAGGTTLFVGGTGGHVRAFDAVTWKKRWEAKEGDHCAVVAPAPGEPLAPDKDGPALAVGVAKGVRLFDAATGKPGDLLTGEWGAMPQAIVWFDNRHTPAADPQLAVTHRKLMFVNAAEHQVLWWSGGPRVERADTIKQTSQAYNVGRLKDEYSVALAVSTDGNGAIVTSPTSHTTGKNRLGLWAAGSDIKNRQLEGHSAAVISAAWSKDRSRLVTGDADGEVISWDVKDFKVKSRLKLGGRVVGLALTPDGKTAAAAVIQPQENKAGGPRYTEEVFAWPTDAPPEKPDPLSSVLAGGPFAGVGSVAFRPDGKELAAAFANFTHLARTGELVGKVRVFAAPPEKAKPAPEVERDEDLWTWRERARPYPGNAGTITWADGIAFRPDGKAFAAVGGDGQGCEVLLFDTATLKGVDAERAGADVPIVGAPPGAIQTTAVEYAFDGKMPASPIGLAYSPDGKLVVVPQPGRIDVRDSATRRVVRRIEQKGSTATIAAFGPVTEVQGKKRYQLAFTDGRAVWSVTWIGDGAAGTAKFGPLSDAPKLDGLPPAGVAFAPDGKRLVFIPNAKKGADWYALVWGGGSGEPLEFLAHGRDPVTAVAWAPDGRIATADAAGTVVIWDGKTFKERKRVKLSGPVTALTFRADGKRLAVGVKAAAKPGEDGAVRVEVVTEQAGSSADNWLTSSRIGLPAAEAVRSLALSPDGLVLVAGVGTADGKGGGLRVWDRVKLAGPAPPNVSDVGFSPDGTKYLALRGGKAEVFDAATGKALYAIEADAARFGADGNTLFALNDKQVLECAADTGKALKATDRPKTNAPWRDAVFSPDGKRVAADTGAHVGVYDIASGKELCQLTVRLTDRVSEFAVGLSGFSPDGTHLAAKGLALEKDGTGGAAVWEVATGKRAAAFADGAMDAVRAICFAPSGDEVAVAYQDRVEVWYIGPNPVKKNPLRKFATAGIVTAVAFSTDGKRLAVGASEPLEKKDAGYVERKSVVQVFDALTGEEVERLAGFARADNTAESKWPVSALAFAPDGKALLAGTGYRFAAPRGGEVKLFDLTAKPEKPVPVAEQK